MIKKFISKFLDSNQKELNNLQSAVEVINRLEGERKKLKDEEFPAQTAAFKQRIADGEQLVDLLPEAFALARV